MNLTGATWRKSARSGGNGGACVEAALGWRKSTRSGQNGGACVEAARTATAVAVRDSKDPGGPHLEFAAPAWRRFALRLKTGDLVR